VDKLSSPPAVVSSSSSRLRLLRRHPLASYFLLAYGFGWLGWSPYVLSQSGLGLLPFHLSQFVILPGAFLGPCLSGFIMAAVTEGKAGVGHLLRRLILWRVGWQWYLFALVGVPAILLLGFLPLPGVAATLRVPSLPFFLAFLLLLVPQIFTSGLAEEPGWRGFALPRLQRNSGPLLGTLILGLLWGGWHLPLFLTAWTMLATNLLMIGEFVLSAMSLAIIITWVFNHTRQSLLIALLLHASVDAFTDAVVMTGLFPRLILLKSAYLALLIGSGVVALLLVLLTRGRLGFHPD
jgi:membrane protease YdiL (CAAX protease family)